MNAETKETQKAAAQDAGLTKFDAPVLKSMETSAMVASAAVAFLPATMAEAMELAKLMASSNFMPKHLRGVPGDCLAVVLQSMRWGMDPFAVGNKTYFVNDRMAYEAQLVNAVVNTSRVLEGRLTIEWDGEGEQLTCKVTGKIKGDPEPKTVWQELRSIKIRNSPLWVSSPRQQLGYYTSRMWGRLHTPEVLMGVYTPDEMYEEEQRQPDGSYVAAPKERPTRNAVREERQARDAAAGLDQGFRAAMGKGAGDDPAEEEAEAGETIDRDTGEVIENNASEGVQDTAQQSQATDPQAEAKTQKAIDDLTALVTKLVGEQGFIAGVDAVLEQYGSDLDWLKEVAPAQHDQVLKVIAAKRDKIKNRGKR